MLLDANRSCRARPAGTAVPTSLCPLAGNAFHIRGEVVQRLRGHELMNNEQLV